MTAPVDLETLAVPMIMMVAVTVVVSMVILDNLDSNPGLEDV
jgi:hypothetical protein